LHNRRRPHVRHDVGQSLEPVADDEEHILDAAVLKVGQHAHPTLEAVLAEVPSPTRKQPALTNALDRLVIAAAPAMDYVNRRHVARRDHLLRTFEGSYFYRLR
jgi:hypothetical protein